MAIAAVIAVVIAALLVIAGGVWVAIGLIMALAAAKPEPPAPHRTDRDETPHADAH